MTMSLKIRRTESLEFGIVTALYLDEILDQIFLYLDRDSLLASRLVCRQWRQVATPHLQKKTHIHLYNFKLGAPDSNKNNQEDKSLDDLSNLLEQSEFLNFVFPCTNFSFTQTSSGDTWANLSDLGFQNFLSMYGSKHIKELSLNFVWGSASRYPCPHDSVVMEQVQNLLLNQTPNLHTLSLNIESNIYWKNKTTYYVGRHSPLQTSDEEYHEIHDKFLSLPPSCRNTSLKVFKVGADELSSKVFETVILLCPNLEEIVFEDPEFQPYWFEPVNRLRFMKTLNFVLSPLRFETMEEIASAMQHQGDVKLRQFSIFFFDSLQLCELDSEFEDRVVSVINRILESSSDSLETIVWYGVAYLNGLKLPLLLPKVTRLELSSQRSGNRIHSFPSDFFSLSTTFPTLKHVSLHRKYSEKNFEKLLNLFNPECNLPVLSVKTVDIIFGNYSSRQDLSLENLQRVSNLFPNALVRNIYSKDST